MTRNLAFVGFAVILVLSTAGSVAAAEFGTAEEAKAMLERAVAAGKEDKAKALDMFNKGEGGFKDRDLYVWCANASDGIITAQPYMNKGKQLRDIKGKHGAPFGETIMQNATEGTIKETTYWWPRPGADEPFEKETSTRRSVTRSVVWATTRNNGADYRTPSQMGIGIRANSRWLQAPATILRTDLRPIPVEGLRLVSSSYLNAA